MTFWKWSKTAATNASADSTINWAEGQAPSTVNDSARAMMAAASKYRDDESGSLLTTGTSTAYVLATNQVFDTLAHLSGAKLKVRFHTASGAAPTLAVDSLTAEPIQVASGTAIGTGVIAANSVWDLTYDNSIPAFLLSAVPAQVQDNTVVNAAIAAGAVSYSKIQNLNNNTILGNFTGGAAPPAEYTLGKGFNTTGSSSTVTITIASPGVVTWNTHGLNAGAPVSLATTGALPTGLSAATTYYVTSPATNTFQLAASPGGAAINTSGSQSGTHTASTVSTITAPATPIPGGFKNLSIKVATNTTVTVAADFVTMTDGTNFQTLAISGTVNLGTTGANALDTGTIAIDTFYAIWAIAKADGTTAVLASTSSTAPTMPSGYTYKARMGWVQTIHSSAILYGTWQFGRIAQYVLGLAQTALIPTLASGAIGTISRTSPALVAASVARFVPPTATRINILLGIQTGAAIGGTTMAAPSAAYSGTNNGPNGSNGVVWPALADSTNNYANANAWMTLESSNIYSAGGAAGSTVNVLGWEDNI